MEASWPYLTSTIHYQCLISTYSTKKSFINKVYAGQDENPRVLNRGRAHIYAIVCSEQWQSLSSCARDTLSTVDSAICVSTAAQWRSPCSPAAAELLTARFARQVLSGRWFTLFACLLILSASGATYAFGIYSRALRSSLGYDQHAVATLAFVKDLGSNAGVPAGLLLEVAPPWAVLGVGAAMNLAGYLMVYLSLAGRVARPPARLMCAYICAGANSQAFAGTAALVTCVRNFPEGRGAVLGLLKGYVGLSSAILAQVYLELYGGADARSLVLLIAWLPAAVSVVFLGTVRVVPTDRKRPRQSAGGDVFLCLLYISVALAAYILVMIVVQREASFSRAAYAASAAGLLVLLFLPLAVVVRHEHRIKTEVEESLPEAAPVTVTVVE